MRILHTRQLRFFLIILLGLLSGCWLTQQENAGNGSISAEILRSGVNGARTMYDSSALWITSRTVLEHVYTVLNNHQQKNDEALPSIDFDKYGVLFLEMGQRPTGGYSIDFTPSQSRVVDKQAIINISWNTPLEGLLLTQAITSPFILLKVYRADITSILVVDQGKQPLFDISVE